MDLNSGSLAAPQANFALGGPDEGLGLGGPTEPLLIEAPSGFQGGMPSDDPIEHLKSITATQTNDAADLLSSWLEADQTAAS